MPSTQLRKGIHSPSTRFCSAYHVALEMLSRKLCEGTSSASTLSTHGVVTRGSSLGPKVASPKPRCSSSTMTSAKRRAISSVSSVERWTPMAMFVK
jgi:hypothetical protein